MFKKQKKKSKEETQTVDNKLQNQRSSNIGTDLSFDVIENRSNGEVTDADQPDGFDSQGFVDLTPAENRPVLLGPKQLCQYVGTFAVSLGTGGEGTKTLTTHKERTRFVKKKLKEYRNAQKGVGVAILTSTDGIKVVSPDGKRVRMAHPLQRISFATCDPEFRLFAYMSHDPSPVGTAIHCHVFMTKYTRQVQSLTALVGKAFQVAFSESKFPQGTEIKLEPLKNGPDGKSPQGRKEQAAPKEEAKVMEQASPTPSKPSPRMGRRRSFGKARTPPEVRRSNIPQGNGVFGQHDRKADPSDVVTDGSPVAQRKIDGSPVAQRKIDGSPVAQRKIGGSPVAQRKISAPVQGNKIYTPPYEERAAAPVITRERSNTPPPSRSDAVSSKQNVSMLPVAKTASDPNLSAADHELTTGNRHESVSKSNSHEDENWYMPGIPREFVIEMLQNSEEGSFFVRDSQSRPGCFALTMRVPKEANPSGFGNFLIVKVKDGVMIQGFDKVLPDLTALVEHYSQHADGLPCSLLISGSNVLCEDEDYMNIVPADPDYQSLSDFTAMMAELS
ncbi:hypothetical protein pdam_00005221 [Pocillopora damicornis]|uniref:SH2 domain-containing protein n=1 Tax=Pocillopora damicornis TaxID=46731 RepID=A0A3M6T4R8_POCDA|nr:hypothetical protein pdam_00005221 [Pocillopora damicornis]